MKGRRTGVDFSNHQLEVVKNEHVMVHHLKQPGTIINNIRYVNISGNLVVTGDFGNWIFCRPFHPSSTTTEVSASYWMEKLEIHSCQVPTKYNPEETLKSLKEYKKDRKKQGWLTKEEKQYLNRCMELVDDHLEYQFYAYRELPHGWDYEDVIHEEKVKPWFQVVLDGFEEICRRLRVEQELQGMGDTPSDNDQILRLSNEN